MTPGMRRYAVLLVLFCLCPPAGAADAVAKLIGLDGQPAGTAKFRSTTHSVLIEIDARGLAPGDHAIMIHTTAACDPKKQFATAGPDFSFDPVRPHGFFAKGGPRAGDLPNQFAGADGRLRASIVTSAFTLGNGAKSVFDRDGASIIIHARADDYLTQPDGKAGDRVACGTIIRTSGPAAHRSRR